MDRFISGAFVWMLTPEGHDYWENIEGKFQKWLDTLPEEELPEVSPKIASLLAGPVFPETLYDIFRTFLKEHGCTVEQFEENMKNDYFRSQDKETITLGKYIEDQNKKYGTVKDLIEHGFIYSGTPQGLGYWDKLHRE